MESVGDVIKINTFHGLSEENVGRIMESVGDVIKTNIFHDLSAENVGKTNISNNFHEFRETLEAGTTVWRIMEIVGNIGKKHVCLYTMSVKAASPTIFHVFRETSGANTIVNPELRNLWSQKRSKPST